MKVILQAIPTTMNLKKKLTLSTTNITLASRNDYEPRYNQPIRTFTWLENSETSTTFCTPYLVSNQESMTGHLQLQIMWVRFGESFGKVIVDFRYNTLDQMGVPAISLNR